MCRIRGHKKDTLLQSGVEGEAYRSAFLPLQSILAPFGFFPKDLVVPATIGAKVALALQGIATYLLIGMTALGIRKRFKLP